MSQFKQFSKKQMQVLGWWNKHSPYHQKSALICDGAVRSGKTICMGMSFILWSFSEFSDQTFAFCGKTIISLRRNLIFPVSKWLDEMGVSYKEKISQNYIEISMYGKTNRFYLFGGKDESSASYIQGLTLAGILFDEVALMPRSFVEQALARCSVEKSRFWFNCNPEHPYHWFYKEWIINSGKKNALYIHFKMTDNPSLSKKMLERYRSLYSGVFYQRFVLGQWVVTDGLVYNMFDEQVHVVKQLPKYFEKYIISCDYGTINPCSFGLWGLSNNIWYRVDEYYYDSKIENDVRTDQDHYNALLDLIGNLNIEKIIVDPSAASFIQLIRKKSKFNVVKATNNVVDGIRRVSDLLKHKQILFSDICKDSIKEFSLYRWKDSGQRDMPIKQNDHAMDDIRYFAMDIFNDVYTDIFYAKSLERK